MQRNGAATGELASVCGRQGVGLVLISTNEVFDGTRTDGVGYGPADAAHPANPYGRSKLAGETAAAEAFAASPDLLGIVRTAWLFGTGKPDFPAKIERAARAAVGEQRPLCLVADEVGTPTYVPDLATAVVDLIAAGHAGVHHVVNAGRASRADWGRDVLRRLGLAVQTQDISLADHDRPSRPPRWGVLATTTLPGGALRSWQEAMTERIPTGILPG
jgi:dTDP-4-dehydrorhamnose reductase